MERELSEEQRKALTDYCLDKFRVISDKIIKDAELNQEPFEVMILSVNCMMQGVSTHTFFGMPTKALLMYWESFYLVFNNLCKQTTGYSIDEIIQLKSHEEIGTNDRMELLDSTNKRMN